MQRAHGVSRPWSRVHYVWQPPPPHPGGPSVCSPLNLHGRHVFFCGGDYFRNGTYRAWESTLSTAMCVATLMHAVVYRGRAPPLDWMVVSKAIPSRYVNAPHLGASNVFTLSTDGGECITSAPAMVVDVSALLRFNLLPAGHANLESVCHSHNSYI